MPGSAAAIWRHCRARTAGNRCVARTAESPTANKSTTPTSEPLDVSDHARAQGRIGQAVIGGAHVLAHVIHPRRRGDGAGDRRMRNDELEQELRPVGAIDLRGPCRQRMTLYPSDQLALAERSIDDDADAPLACQRKNAVFDLAVE